MDHSYFRDKISAYSDGALEAQERELIRRHLEECAECRHLLERLQHLSATIEEKSRLKNDEYFESLAKKIEQKIAVPDEKIVDIREYRWRSFWWKVGAAAATLVLVGTIGYYQLQDDQEMPAKILEDFRSNRESVTARADSVSVNEEPQSQGGRTDAREITGQVAESETGQVKKEESNVPVGREKDRLEVVDPKLPKGSVKYAPTSTTVSKPVESKAKSEDTETAASEKADVGSVVTDDADDYIMLDATSDSISRLQLTLSQWRSQRDSIQNVLGLEQDTVVNSMNSQLKRLAAPSVSGLAKVDDSTIVYQVLANSWFQIALQTQDGNEKNRAVQFLNWYKNRFPSDSPAVNVQLQQVPK